jgi:hypothetical protein
VFNNATTVDTPVAATPALVFTSGATKWKLQFMQEYQRRYGHKDLKQEAKTRLRDYEQQTAAQIGRVVVYHDEEQAAAAVDPAVPAADNPQQPQQGLDAEVEQG